MAFWIITVLLALVVSGLFALALLRRADKSDATTDYNLRVYRDQLTEIDRDLERGILTQEDADSVRTEVSRRLLAADVERTLDTEFTKGSPKIVSAVVALILVGGSVGLYKGFGPINGLGAPGYTDLALADRIAFADSLRDSRPSQARAESSLTDLSPVAEYNADYLNLVQTLRDTVAERPDDIRGHALLVQNESNMGNFIAAYQSQARIIELKGEDTTIEDLTGYTDLLILAAGGYVSPEAEQTARVVLTRDPTNGIARYYIGLMLAQTGRPDMAFRIWDRLLQIGPERAPWIAPILEQIPEMARHAGVNYQIPTIGNGRITSLGNGPTDADIEAASEMTGAERIQMIEGMVSGLSDRLATSGGPAEDWAQLIGALGVLGRSDQAFAIYKNAETVFADDPSSLDLVTRAAQRAGVAE